VADQGPGTDAELVLALLLPHERDLRIRGQILAFLPSEETQGQQQEVENQVLDVLVVARWEGRGAGHVRIDSSLEASNQQRSTC